MPSLAQQMTSAAAMPAWTQRVTKASAISWSSMTVAIVSAATGTDGPWPSGPHASTRAALRLSHGQHASCAAPP
jgi:hypothetical protein